MGEGAKGKPRKASPAGAKGTSPSTRGLAADGLRATSPPAAVEGLARAIEGDGGSVLATYCDPLGAHWQLLAALPLERVEPTPYQRDLSESHVARLADAIHRLDRFLDPVIAVRAALGKYWTPNGHHRVAALRALGARSVVALVVPEVAVAHRILALNTEKAHNLRERALEVARLARALAELEDRTEREYETEFEEPALLTLGLCYEQHGRFAGGAYHPVLRRVERFLPERLSEALEARRARATRLIALDEAVTAAVNGLKARGFQSPYLRAFVVARINPLRFKRDAKAEFEETIEAMLTAARTFDASRVRADQLAQAAGPPEE